MKLRVQTVPEIKTFVRGGIRFERKPTYLNSGELTTSQLEAIQNERLLVVTEVEEHEEKTYNKLDVAYDLEQKPKRKPKRKKKETVITDN